MSAMAYAGAHAAVLLGSAAAIAVLRRARWTWRAPRLAIASWQAVGLAFGLSLIGLPMSIGLAPYGGPTAVAVAAFTRDLVRGDLAPAVSWWHLAAVAVGALIAVRLVYVTGVCLARAVRAQRRHRQVLALVGRADPAAPGALVLDHPSAAAYCLPGLRPTVVVSAGTLHLLRGSEVAAVLSHERSHATERHDLVLLPFTALCRAVPSGWLRAGHETVALLVEMRADDRASRHHPQALVAALRRFAFAPATGVPAGALGVAERAVVLRLRRLRDGRGPAWARSLAMLVGAAALAAAPAGMFLYGG